MKPFDDPEVSRKLPADVLAFAQEVEAKTKSAMSWRKAGDVVYKDVPALIAIVREQAADLDQCGRILGQVVCAGTLRSGESLIEPFEHAAVQAILDKIRQRNEAISERNALRGRLAKLETRELMRARSALDSEKELHRRTLQDLGFASARLAKLETAARRVLGLLFESSACDEPCDCIDCQCIETLDALGLTE